MFSLVFQLAPFQLGVIHPMLHWESSVPIPSFPESSAPRTGRAWVPLTGLLRVVINWTD